MNIHRILTFLLLAPVLSLTPAAEGAGLVSGHHTFSVELAPMVLDGTYPFVVGNIDSGAFFTVTTDKTGKLSGVIEIRSVKTPVAGKIVATRQAIKLVLNGTDRTMPFRVRAILQGDRFVGTASSRGKVPCVLDLSSVGPLVTVYDVTLAVDAHGKIAGGGTATTGRQQIAVKASGFNRARISTLRLLGDRTIWMGSGAPQDGGFTAKWSARGFGAAMKGERLDVVAQ